MKNKNMLKENMYEKKEKIYFIIAIAYYIVYVIGFLLMGMLYQKGINLYHIIYCFLFILGISIVIIKDKSITNLGFTKEKLKVNLIISFTIVAVTFVISVLFRKHTIAHLIKKSLYYLFYIGLVEEILFRGFIQNYLFGLKCNKYIVFIIGAILFSLMHLPFQMYRHNNVSLDYIIEVYPQLLWCFGFHLIMCFITDKRKDITIPTVLHYAENYLLDIL